jgi:hypothetical protein
MKKQQGRAVRQGKFPGTKFFYIALEAEKFLIFFLLQSTGG